jgi:ribosome-binding factor A
MSEARLARVADQIQREIATLISSGQVKDDRIGFVTITGVTITEDMKEAKVYFTAHGTEAAQKSSAEALLSNAGRFRSHIGKEMKIRHAPLLRFVHDDSIEEGAKIERLLSEVRKKEGW